MGWSMSEVVAGIPGLDVDGLDEEDSNLARFLRSDKSEVGVESGRTAEEMPFGAFDSGTRQGVAGGS